MLQVLVSAGDVNPGQSKSDSGLGSSASKPGKSITKHSEEVSEVAAPDGKKTRPERRQTISEYLREAGGSQLNGDVLDAIKTLQVRWILIFGINAILRCTCFVAERVLR